MRSNPTRGDQILEIAGGFPETKTLPFWGAQKLGRFRSLNNLTKHAVDRGMPCLPRRLGRRH